MVTSRYGSDPCHWNDAYEDLEGMGQARCQPEVVVQMAEKMGIFAGTTGRLPTGRFRFLFLGVTENKNFGVELTSSLGPITFIVTMSPREKNITYHFSYILPSPSRMQIPPLHCSRIGPKTHCPMEDDPCLRQSIAEAAVDVHPGFLKPYRSLPRKIVERRW